MQAKIVNPFTVVIPMAIKAILSGFIAWCAMHGYGMTVLMSGILTNEEQMEALIDDFINQGIQTNNL